MPSLEGQRATLATMLRKHGDDDLADRVAQITDEELARIRRLGAYYASPKTPWRSWEAGLTAASTPNERLGSPLRRRYMALG